MSGSSVRKPSIAEIRAWPEFGEARELPPQTLARKFPRDLWELIRNRMLMGYERYGAGRSAWKEQVINDPLPVTLTRMLSKFLQFLWTRNLEFLVDVMVYGCLIWRFGGDRRLHFEAVERHNIAEMKKAADALAARLMLDLDRPWLGNDDAGR